ncbi:uncharacterized protein L199_007649 [Kwoniella botswanensis]|uniref:uncharacterized protein n=1 Tax=Kwoniella botswanensis TaxID=1268659 RepID=UPI00315DCC41
MYDAATWEETISNALTKVNQGSAIKYERVKNFTKEDSEEVLSLPSDSYKDIPYHKYTFESSPEARRSYLLAGLGKRVDPKVCDREDTNESCEIITGRSRSDGEPVTLRFQRKSTTLSA